MWYYFCYTKDIISMKTKMRSKGMKKSESWNHVFIHSFMRLTAMDAITELNVHWFTQNQDNSSWILHAEWFKGCVMFLLHSNVMFYWKCKFKKMLSIFHIFEKLIPRPAWVLKPVDIQFPYIKCCSIVSGKNQDISSYIL